MNRLSYLAVLAFIVLGTSWLPWATGAVVWQKLRRLALSVLPGFVLFAVWDWYAIRSGHWSFDPQRLLAVRILGLPLEELLFFIVIPVASVLTLEAVRAVRGSRVGDEQ